MPDVTSTTPAANSAADTAQVKSRVWIAVILGLVILTGILPRLMPVALPPLIGKHLGDTLWSVMFFLLVQWIRPAISPLRAGLLAFAIAAAIEFLKLCHTPWLDALRAHRIAGFLLGRRFLWTNFIAYGIGILAAILLDVYLTRRRVLSNVKPSPPAI